MISQMKFYVSKPVLFGFIGSLASLAALAFFSYWNTQRSFEANKWVSHTNEVLYNIERIRSIVVNLESSQRGYVITGNELFYSKNKTEAFEIRNQIVRARQLMSDNKDQQQRIDSLNRLIDQKLKFNDETVQTAGADRNLASSRIASLEGEGLKEKIIGVISLIERTENALLYQRIKQTQKESSLFNYSFGALVFFMAVLIVMVFFGINATLNARAESQKELNNALEEIHDLYNNSPCGYFSLDTDGNVININDSLLNQLGYSRNEVLNKNYLKILVEDAKSKERFDHFKKTGIVTNREIQLRKKDEKLILFNLSATALFDKNKKFIRSRTTLFDITERKKAEVKVQELAKELEAFTYSVSHDLRAPLRSISGYVKILEEDYHQVLDQEGKRLLSVVDRNATNMGALIDDLLDFTRMNRTEISGQVIDLDDMVNHIINDLHEMEKGRGIKFKIEPLGFIKGDLSMMRQVWINLISNAIKYTRKTDHPLIEISSHVEEKKRVFVIRDNGVGFDMKYAHKLFGVFQRLHKAEDFEGTGVGLALVHRIISRHGGNIWADAAPNQGAAFSFYTDMEPK